MPAFRARRVHGWACITRRRGRGLAMDGDVGRRGGGATADSTEIVWPSRAAQRSGEGREKTPRVSRERAPKRARGRESARARRVAGSRAGGQAWTFRGSRRAAGAERTWGGDFAGRSCAGSDRARVPVASQLGDGRAAARRRDGTHRSVSRPFPPPGRSRRVAPHRPREWSSSAWMRVRAARGCSRESPALTVRPRHAAHAPAHMRRLATSWDRRSLRTQNAHGPIWPGACPEGSPFSRG